MFKELDKREASLVEEERIKKWGGVGSIYEKSLLVNKDNDKFVFYDGPATANGFPGLHHMLPKFLKDSFCKYHSMNGKRVVRKVGWDTHGLPVELQVEKELGFSGKQDIEKYGIKEFNEKCRESVWKNKEAFTDLTSKMGQFINIDDPYVTYATVALEYKEETQTYEGTFTMTEPTDKNSRITFDCGASECGVPYTVQIENLVLLKVEETAETTESTSE